MEHRNILLIEDNQDDIDLTLRAFKKNHLNVTIEFKYDVASAIGYLNNVLPELLPKLILLDINLPKVNGLEFLKTIRKEDKFRTIPIVVLTTSNEDIDIKESYRHGANSYIRKPIDYNEFVESVNYIGKYWLYINETLQDI